MARIRSIKPEFPQSESMGNVSREARLTFVQLWTLADDEGRLRGNSRMLASLLFPYDDDAPGLIDAWLADLEREKCIQRYQIDGSSYIQILNWMIHQKIDKPSKSKIPPFGDSSRALANAREESSGDLRIKDQGVECDREEAPPMEADPPKKKKSAKRPIPEDFDLNDERKAYAEKHLPAVDAAALMAVFRSTSKAKGWAYSDWDQHWQTLVRHWAPDSGHWSSGQYPRKTNGRQKMADGTEVRW